MVSLMIIYIRHAKMGDYIKKTVLRNGIIERAPIFKNGDSIVQKLSEYSRSYARCPDCTILLLCYFKRFTWTRNTLHKIIMFNNPKGHINQPTFKPANIISNILKTLKSFRQPPTKTHSFQVLYYFMQTKKDQTQN